MNDPCVEEGHLGLLLCSVLSFLFNAARETHLSLVTPAASFDISVVRSPTN